VDDLVVAVATAIASGAGGSLGTSGAAAAGRLISALRAKFRHSPAARGALEIAVDEPTDPDAGVALQVALNELITRDAEFGQWLATVWEEMRQELPSYDCSSKNIIDGEVHGTAVQARDIHGGIHINRDA
jgi:hypothetical protein